jgi:hypothetical protein
MNTTARTAQPAPEAWELFEEGADGNEHCQRGDDDQGLGLGVVAAGGEGGEVKEGAGAEGDRDGRLTAVYPPGDADQEGEDCYRSG